MTATDLELLEAVHDCVARQPGLKSVRLVRPGEARKAELPLSRLPAAFIEPGEGDDVETLAWPDLPVGAYRLLPFTLSILDRAVPGTRAFEALGDLAVACRDAVAADPLLRSLTADGPPAKRLAAAGLAPAAGGVRLSPMHMGSHEAGRPTELFACGALGVWVDPPPAADVTLDGESLFASGPHLLTVGSPVRQVKDQPFNGLSGGLAIDLGDGPREIVQTGVLSAATDAALAVLEAAVEAFVDGRAYTLAASGGAEYPHCRLERFERTGPVARGVALHRPYRITYRQLAR